MQISLFQILDIGGTFSFAAAGAFAAMEKKFDPFGVLIIAFVSAIGGGTIRDLLIGNTPVAWLKDLTSAEVIFAGAVLALASGRRLKKLDPLLLLFDAIGLGLFTMTGIQKGIEYHLSSGICIMLGTLTACFGGVIRDVLLNKLPLIFQKEIYASASIAGGCIYFLCIAFSMNSNLVNILTIVIIFLIRLLAIKLNWSLPRWYNQD